jgi:hypothetical protein
MIGQCLLPPRYASFGVSAISDVQVQMAGDSKERCYVGGKLSAQQSAIHTRSDVTENGVRKMPAMFRHIRCHKHTSMMFRHRKWRT